MHIEAFEPRHENIQKFLVIQDEQNEHFRNDIQQKQLSWIFQTVWGLKCASLIRAIRAQSWLIVNQFLQCVTGISRSINRIGSSQNEVRRRNTTTTTHARSLLYRGTRCGRVVKILTLKTLVRIPVRTFTFSSAPLIGLKMVS